ncbi:MAG TPA: phosphoglycolate phosphatase [Thermoplasmata archaeon]|nr:phosphoglycolate phosphatase [Thermoplasmata archaeon]
MTDRARGTRVPRPRIRRLRAVVTDVDGTLTDARRRLDPQALAWIHRLEAHGLPVVLATGNVLPIALALHRFLGLSGPIVAENGGVVYDRRDGVDRVERLADRAVAEKAFRRLQRAKLPVRRLFTDRWRESEVALEPNVSLARIRRALGDLPVFVEATGFAIHLMEQRAGKLPALVRILASRGLALEECVVLGDGDNDVAMLRAAGFGVSFPSGSRRARTAAGYVTRARFGRGFVEGLKASQILAGAS